MGEVDQHPDAVHFAHDFAAKVAQTIVLVLGARGRIANIVVAVVAERHIDHAFSTEEFYICEVVPNGIAVFNAQKDGALVMVLRPKNIVGADGQNGVLGLVDHRLDRSKQMIGFGAGAAMPVSLRSPCGR